MKNCLSDLYSDASKSEREPEELMNTVRRGEALCKLETKDYNLSPEAEKKRQEMLEKMRDLSDSELNVDRD